MTLMKCCKKTGEAVSQSMPLTGMGKKKTVTKDSGIVCGFEMGTTGGFTPYVFDRNSNGAIEHVYFIRHYRARWGSNPNSAEQERLIQHIADFPLHHPVPFLMY